MSIIAIGEVAAVLTKAGIDLHDSNQRRKFDQAVAGMNAAKQRELADKLAKEQSNAMRMQIIADAIKKQQQNQYIPIYIGAGLLLTGLIVTLIILKK